MSSIKLFPYKIYKGQWFRAKELTDSDIAVIVDTDSDIIWYYEGDKSSARMRNHARDILGQLKKKYIKYTFKRVSPNTPESILVKLDDLKKESFKGKIPGVKLGLRDFSQLFYTLGIIAGGLLVFSLIYLLTALAWAQDTETFNHAHFVVNYISLNTYIDVVSFSILFTFILSLISAFFGSVIQKKAFSMLIAVTAIFSFFTFFLLRIWNAIIFTEQIGNLLYLRKDVVYLYLFVISLLNIIGITFAFYGGISGFMGLNNTELVETEKKSIPEKIEKPKTKTIDPEPTKPVSKKKTIKKDSKTTVKKTSKKQTNKPPVKKVNKPPVKKEKKPADKLSEKKS